MHLVTVVDILIGRIILLFLLIVVILSVQVTTVYGIIGVDIVNGRAALVVVRVPQLLVVPIEECIPGAFLSLEVLKPRALDNLRSLLRSHHW